MGVLVAQSHLPDPFASCDRFPIYLFLTTPPNYSPSSYHRVSGRFSLLFTSCSQNDRCDESDWESFCAFSAPDQLFMPIAPLFLGSESVKKVCPPMTSPTVPYPEYSHRSLPGFGKTDCTSGRPGFLLRSVDFWPCTGCRSAAVRARNRPPCGFLAWVFDPPFQ